jgi:NAD(P)-dependent dehydrogenase (short-subunit alcohol dehydrogenase family)
MTDRLKNKTALITGATRGIGLAIAEVFAAEGANLVLNARDPVRLNEVAAKIKRNNNVAVSVHPCDVTDFRDLFEANFMSVLHLTQLVLPGMIARRSGRIVNLASTAGKWGSRNQSAYNVSKHAVVGLTRCLGLEMAPHNIGVNAICPWIVDTDMATGFIAEHANAADITPEQATTNFVAAVPIKRFIRPAEVAGLAVYLASDEASYISGQSWTVDGGYTML